MKASRVMGVPQAGQGAADSFLKNESKRIGIRRAGRARRSGERRMPSK